MIPGEALFWSHVTNLVNIRLVIHPGSFAKKPSLLHFGDIFVTEGYMIYHEWFLKIKDLLKTRSHACDLVFKREVS